MESTGAQYVNTGVTFDTSDTDYEILASIQWDESALTSRCLWGYNPSASGYFGVNNGYYELGGAKGTVSCSTTSFDNVRIYRKDSTYQLYINNTLATTRGIDKYSGEYYIFKLNNWGGYNKAKLSYFKIIKNGELVLDLVPYRNNTTNAGCLYDRVSGTFYASGTSTPLVAGNVK